VEWRSAGEKACATRPPEIPCRGWENGVRWDEIPCGKTIRYRFPQLLTPFSHPFEALKRIKPSELVSEGRVYGGGLHKVEPKELAQIPARLVLESIDAHLHIELQDSLFG
jgi:hypothetical protein